MTYSSDLADIRFGCGLSPDIPAPASVADMLDRLTGPDRASAEFPIPLYSDISGDIGQFRELRASKRKARGTAKEAEFVKQAQDVAARARDEASRWYGHTLLRWAHTPDGLRERLVDFWADHFTVVGKTGVFRHAGSPFQEEVVRPRLTGSFVDLLIAATTHPMMLQYLDQSGSIGPNSRSAERTKRAKRGLNENLAREVLELHTLGVEGPYTQTDVRELAELFTGMTLNLQGDFKFSRDRSERGAETVLGATYGGDPANIDAIHAVLRDLAVHPATARHIAWKLAVHFVSDTPDAGLVDHVAARYLETGGDLLAVYGALLEHPAAWDPTLRNVKPPHAFVASTFRALAVPRDRVTSLKTQQTRFRMIVPTGLMGQTWQSPGGPDGWPEEDTAWITPQGLAARVRWAMTVPSWFSQRLPDPRVFVDQALGDYATEPVRFAAGAAETRPEAIGLVLSSPAFQRR